MNKKSWSFIIISVVVSLVILSWFGYQTFIKSSVKLKADKQIYKEKIVIGMVPWPGYFPLIVAQAKGFFKEAGLDVEIKRYDGLKEISIDYAAGKMQGRANLTLDAIRESLDGLDHKVILAIDYSSGADAIMAQAQVKTIEDFRRQKIAYEVGTLEEFFLTWALTENAMSLSDILTVNANPEEAAKKLSAGEVAVAVTYEPFVSQALKTGNFHVIYSSADAPGLITDILTFRTDFIVKHPEVVQAIVKVYFRAFEVLKSHPEDVYAILAKEFGDTPESIAKQLQGITTLDIRDNQTAFTFAAGLKSLYGNMRQIGEFIQKHHEGKEVRLDTDELIERKFIKNLNNQP